MFNLCRTHRENRTNPPFWYRAQSKSGSVSSFEQADRSFSLGAGSFLFLYPRVHPLILRILLYGSVLKGIKDKADQTPQILNVRYWQSRHDSIS